MVGLKDGAQMVVIGALVYRSFQGNRHGPYSCPVDTPFQEFPHFDGVRQFHHRQEHRLCRSSPSSTHEGRRDEGSGTLTSIFRVHGDLEYRVQYFGGCVGCSQTFRVQLPSFAAEGRKYTFDD